MFIMTLVLVITLIGFIILQASKLVVSLILFSMYSHICSEALVFFGNHFSFHFSIQVYTLLFCCSFPCCNTFWNNSFFYLHSFFPPLIRLIRLIHFRYLGQPSSYTSFMLIFMCSYSSSVELRNSFSFVLASKRKVTVGLYSDCIRCT